MLHYSVAVTLQIEVTDCITCFSKVTGSQLSLPHEPQLNMLSRDTGVLAVTISDNKCYDTIRYDTRCYFNVRTKADVSQLNLPHGTDN